MQKTLFTLFLLFTFGAAFSQKLDDLKEKVQKKKYAEAKEGIDKFLSDPKNAGNSDAWFIKAQVYSNLSSATPTDTALTSGAVQAMGRYLQLESSKPEGQQRMQSLLENNKTIVDIYQQGFQNGVKNYQAKNYADAHYHFAHALESFGYLSKYNVTTAKFDTTTTLYAGISAQNAKMYDAAAKYYDQIINAHITDTSYMEIYQYMINYYLEKKDTATALKYLDVTEAAYPKKTDLWTDYRVSLMSNDKTKRIPQYESLLARYPNNFNLRLNYGIDLYNYAFNNETKPADYNQRKEKALKALQDAVALDNNSTMGNFILARYYMNEVYDLQDDLRTVKGNTPADAAKRRDFNAKIMDKYEKMYPYAQKAYDLFSTHVSTLKTAEKANYKEVINDLIEYYSKKKQADKVALYEAKAKEIH